MRRILKAMAVARRPAPGERYGVVPVAPVPGEVCLLCAHRPVLLKDAIHFVHCEDEGWEYIGLSSACTGERVAPDDHARRADHQAKGGCYDDPELVHGSAHWALLCDTCDAAYPDAKECPIAGTMRWPEDLDVVVSNGTLS